MIDIKSMQPAYLGDAGLRRTIRFETPLLRLVDGEARIVRDDGDKPVMLKVEGEITYFVRRNDHVPYPIIEYRVTGHRRTFKSRPDMNIQLAEEA